MFLSGMSFFRYVFFGIMYNSSFKADFLVIPRLLDELLKNLRSHTKLVVSVLAGL
jgi:hypothetical protein